MRKILGLDLGSYSIKAIEIEYDYKTYRVHAFHEVEVETDEKGNPSVGGGRKALAQLFLERHAQGDRIFTAFPALFASFRFFEFQGLKKSKIGFYIFSEMEELSILGEQDPIIDYQILSYHEKHSHVLGVACQKNLVSGLIEELERIDQQPKIIEIDAIAYGNLIPYLSIPSESDGNILILDFGHSQTIVTLVNQKRLIASRSINRGGQNITLEIAKQLNISFQDAQKWKHLVSRLSYEEDPIDPKLDPDSLEGQVAAIAALQLQIIVKEIIRTLHSFKVSYGAYPSHIFVTGGSSQFKNLPHFLETALGCPTTPIHLSHEKLVIDQIFQDKIPSMMQSLALGARGLPERPQNTLNLRRGELSLSGSYDRLFTRILKGTAICTGILVLLFTTVTIKWWVYQSKIEQIKNEYRTTMKSIFNEEPKALQRLANQKGWSLKNYAQAGKKIILQNLSSRQAMLEQYRNQDPLFPLTLLSEVSKAIPADLKVEFSQFELVSKTLTVVGETQNFSDAEEVLNQLKKLSPQFFSSVERLQQEEKAGSMGRAVKFKIAATLAKDF